MTSLHEFSAHRLDGTVQELAAYRGRVVLVVNTASKCGLTPQFGGLESLYDDLRDEGLVVLGFPCDQFANQEFQDADAIGSFCQVNYGVTFPMFAKIDVNGPKAHPLFVWLRSEANGVLGNSIKWNFTKFLVGRDGRVIRRYAPTVAPADLREDVRTALAS